MYRCRHQPLKFAELCTGCSPRTDGSFSSASLEQSLAVPLQPLSTPREETCSDDVTGQSDQVCCRAARMDGDQSYEYAVGGHEDDVSEDSQAT